MQALSNVMINTMDKKKKIVILKKKQHLPTKMDTTSFLNLQEDLKKNVDRLLNRIMENNSFIPNIEPGSKNFMHGIFNSILFSIISIIKRDLAHHGKLSLEDVKFLHTKKVIFKELCKTTPTRFLDFWTETYPEKRKIIVTECPQDEILKSLELDRFWKKLSETTQSDVWKKISQLDIIVEFVDVFPQELFLGMEQLLKSCIKNPPNGNFLDHITEQILMNDMLIYGMKKFIIDVARTIGLPVAPSYKNLMNKYENL